MNRAWLILTFLFSLPFLGMAHGDKTPIQISGVILENGSAQGVSGAVVNIEKNGQVIHTTKTDDSGNFDFQIEGMPRMDQVKVSVYKKGYKSTEFRPFDGCMKNLRIPMQRQSVIPIIKPVGGAPLLSI